MTLGKLGYASATRLLYSEPAVLRGPLSKEKRSFLAFSSVTIQPPSSEPMTNGGRTWSPYIPLQVTPTMAKEKKFRDGKRKKKGLSRKQRRVAASLKEKGLSSSTSPSDSKKKASNPKKKRKAQRRQALGYIGRTWWSEHDWVSWNRRRTTGVSVEELTPNTIVTERLSFAIVETNLDVDLKMVEARRVQRRKKTLTSLLARSDLDV